jgi:hypothetical protein
VDPHLSNLLHHPAEILDESGPSAIRLNIRPVQARPGENTAIAASVPQLSNCPPSQNIISWEMPKAASRAALTPTSLQVSGSLS